MSLTKRITKSRSYRMISTSLSALVSRILRLPPHLMLRMGQKLFISIVIPVLVGVVIFGLCERLVFDINLWHGARACWALSRTLWWSGFGLCLSILVGSWSVGGAFLHIMGSSGPGCDSLGQGDGKKHRGVSPREISPQWLSSRRSSPRKSFITLTRLRPSLRAAVHRKGTRVGIG
jgi:hypothetical protein